MTVSTRTRSISSSAAASLSLQQERAATRGKHQQQQYHQHQQLQDDGVLSKPATPSEAAAGISTRQHQRRGVGLTSITATAAAAAAETMASAPRKGKGRVVSQGNGTGKASSSSSTAAIPSTTMPDILPAPATSTSSAETLEHDNNLTRSARSSSRRRASGRHTVAALQEPEAQDQEQEPVASNTPTLHDVPDNVLHAQGLSAISTSLIDNLPERAFPKKGITLNPLDKEDPLLILCGKVLASVDNRALTPKEIALILARRHGWLFSGSQPFAIVSSCIRSHVKRANTSNPPYQPIFIPYEMSSVPPAEDVPCLGIEVDAKPVVKRGTFWYLSEQMGYGHAFPHRRASTTALIKNTSLSSDSTTAAQPQASTSSSNLSNTTHRRSSSRHQPQLAPAPAQPIPIMPAPAPTAATTTSSLPTLAPSRSKSDSKPTDRLTRAQKNAQSSSNSNTTTPPILSKGIVQSPSPALEGEQAILSTSAPAVSSGMQIDTTAAGRGKRKRTTSKAATIPAVPQPLLPATMTAEQPTYPHLQPLPAAANAASAAQPVVTTKAPPHRRALSSSASDKADQKAIPALRKLKFRLSAVSETAVLDTSDTSMTDAANLSVSSLPSTTTTTKKITISNSKINKNSSGPKSSSTKTKRQRTQSMSHRTNTTASFPFDDLHLHHSMQQQQGSILPSSLHNAPSFHHTSSSSAEGTLFPFEMHIPSSPANALDLLTSRSAPEGNIFSPALAAGNAANGGASTSYIAGPFSRSHSPSSSLLHYHHHHIGRRSLPPDYGNEDQENNLTSEESSIRELEYDGWGMEQDHLAMKGGKHGSKQEEGAEEENSFHEAMLKNDEIDFAFDFSLGSLGQSASRPYHDDELQGGNLSLESQQDRGHDGEVDTSLATLPLPQDGSHDSSMVMGDDNQSRRRRSSTVRQGSKKSSSPSAFGKHEMDSMLDGLDDEEVEKSNETVKDSKRAKRPSSASRRTSATSEDVEMSGEGDDAALQEEELLDKSEQTQGDAEEEVAVEEDDHSHAALLDRQAFEKALNTTLCPAAAKFVGGNADGSKPARQLAKRMNSSSGLTFTRTVPKPSSNEAVNRSPTATPLLRPALVSRTNSRDVLTTPVPLAELPSIPLENSRRDSFLFYHLTSDADHPSDFSSSYISATGRENENSTRDDMSDAASSSSASTSSSLLTRIVKSEEELDEMVDLEEHAAAAHDEDSPATHRGVSRCCSTASAASEAEIESNDSFNPEMIYPIGRRAPSAELGNIGGQGEIDELQQHTSRSQSSSRTTSLSPRDSFSPHMTGPHGSSSDLDADWALTPPSEEEHVDEEEKNLDRATMLGLESVGMDDLDDVWPGVRRSHGGTAPSIGTGTGNIEAQVDGVTCDFKIMEVFEPVLSAAPIPQVDLPSPVFVMPTLASAKSESKGAEDTAMEVDPTPMDEHTAAAMFIADESLHPPKPAPIVTVTAAPEEVETNTSESSLSPVSAAAEDVTSSANLQEPTSNTVNDLQQKSATVMEKETSTTPVQQHAPSPQRQQTEPSASTQSFLFNPDVPFHPEISILLTDTKILFYSTIVNVSNDGRPLLRRVDNDAVDAEALLLSLEGASDLDVDRLETLRKIKDMGNTWVSLDFARELLKKYGGPEPLLGIFLADDILLSWPEKLVKLGTMLRQKNGLPPPASLKGKVPKTASMKPEKSVHRVPSVSPRIAEKTIQPKKPSKSPVKEERTKETTPVPIQAKKEVEIAPAASTPSSPGKKDKATKASTSARRASSRIKPSGT